MSLINKMLQDLEARQPSGGLGLPNDVHPLPPHESRLPALLLAVLLAALAISFAVRQWGVWPRDPESPTALPIRSVSQALPAVTPVAVREAQSQPTPGKEGSVEVPSKAPERKEFLPLLDFEASLRLSDTLNANRENKPERKSEMKAGAASPGPGAVAKPPRSEQQASPETVRSDVAGRKSAAATASRSLVAPMIERTDAVGSSRERADVEYRKAIAAVNMGRMPEALDGLRNALKHDGEHSASRQLLIKLLLEMKRPEDAMQALREGVQAQPAHLGWAMALARLQVDRGELAGAWETLEYSLPVAGASGDFQGFAAHVLQRLGRSKEAAVRYQSAVQLSPREGRWWLGLGLVLEADGRSDEAKEAFARAKQCGNLSAELNTLLDQKLH